MEWDDVSNYLLPRTPFAEVEATESIVKAALADALSYYNKYLPITKTIEISCPGFSYDFIGTGIPDNILRVYMNDRLSRSQSQNSLWSEWQYEKPTLYITAGFWLIRSVYFITLETVNFDTQQYLGELFIAEANIKMADKRRSAEMSELPFDLKGDTFRSEYNDEKMQLRDKIAELVSVHF